MPVEPATDAMEVSCRGCAGCCIDWRPLASVEDHERRGPRRPLDDVYNLVPLSRDDVRALVEAGLGDAMVPRLWLVEDGPAVTVDGYEVAAIEGKPAFFVGLRTVPKPVDPFDTDPRWLPTCIFLDPRTLQCRIHGAPEYPEECAAYPGHNLSLGAETECERVETHFDGERLLDAQPPDDAPPPLLGPQAVGQKVFAYPEPEELSGVVERLAAGRSEPADRARFVAVAAASAPGTTAIETQRFESTLAAVRGRVSWIAPAIDEWRTLAESAPADPDRAAAVEDDRGASPTPGWD
jgi:Fe-S-cluster containining protein